MNILQEYFYKNILINSSNVSTVASASYSSERGDWTAAAP